MRKQTVYFLKGLPASGKSTWAKQKIEEDLHKGIITKRVNKDDLRAMLDNSVYSKERESFVLNLRDKIIQRSLREGFDVIVDDTNLHAKHLKQIKNVMSQREEVCKHANLPLPELKEVFFDTPLQDCIERDSKRKKPVGRKVIMGMYNRYLRNTKQETIPYNPELPDCIIVDVDGTLALHENRRSPFEYWKAGEDRVNEPIADLVYTLQRNSNDFPPEVVTIVMTGRENLIKEFKYPDGMPYLFSIEKLTEEWLHKNDIHFNDIFIRKEGDHRPDWEVKRELYETFIKNQYNVLYVLDDRKQVIDMWRSIGLTVLDVAGNTF